MTPCAIADPTVCLGTADTIDVALDDPDACVLCRRRRRRLDGRWTRRAVDRRRRAMLPHTHTHKENP